jgi:aryl-alcohol dehydrogenase-like predicted oxidoreductase
MGIEFPEVPHGGQWTRDVEAEILPLLRTLGIGFVPYSPLGHGLLTGQICSVADFPDDDWRKSNPRFSGENLQRNERHDESNMATIDR